VKRGEHVGDGGTAGVKKNGINSEEQSRKNLRLKARNGLKGGTEGRENIRNLISPIEYLS